MKSEKKYEKLPNETFDEYLDRVSAAAKPKPPEWPKALAKQRWVQRQRDLDADRRPRAIDAVWEQTLMEKRLQAEEPSPAENRDTRRFNSLEEAEQFTKEMRRTIVSTQSSAPRTLRRWLRPLTMLQSINAWLIGQYCKIRPLSTP